MAGFRCTRCGAWHDTLPFAFHADAPAYWEPALEADEDSGLSSDQCVIRGELFFAKGLLVLPVHDAEQDFEYGVWMSLSEGTFERMTELWETPNREREPPYPGFIATELPGYEPSTLDLVARMRTRPVGLRPLVELSATDHPLAVEQREGISVARVEEIAALLAHES